MVFGDKNMEGKAESSGVQGGDRDLLKKLITHRRLSVLSGVIGVVVIIVFGYVEDEPNLIGPVLIVLAIGWFFITRARIRSHRR